MDKYQLHPDFEIFRHFHSPIDRYSLRLLRGALGIRKYALRRGKKITCERIHDKRIHLDLFVYRPKNCTPRGTLVYFPGGGFVFPPMPMHYRLLRQYAEVCQCNVFVVFYRLAPKHSYFEVVGDCLNAYKWIVKHANELGVDLNKLAVGGDSAGAALSAITMYSAIEQGLPLPKFQMYTYPFFDIRLNSNSANTYYDAPIWNRKMSYQVIEYYVPNWHTFNPLWQVSPIDYPNFAILPPAYVETAQFDMLHDDGVAFARKLQEAGVPCTLVETKGTIHGYDIARDTPFVREIVAARQKMLIKTFDELGK